MEDTIDRRLIMEKWKTFPCRDCVLKKTCSKACFEWPVFRVVENHVVENKLQHICLSCGIITQSEGFLVCMCNECMTNR